jgi:hypothetical protein
MKTSTRSSGARWRGIPINQQENTVPTPQNILEIEMLLNAHCFAGFKPKKSESHDDALDRLIRADMVQLSRTDNTVTTTLRGQFWIAHLLHIPYPVVSYEIPKTGGATD